MFALFAFLATVPWWIERVGLFQYIGVEILVWVMYGLAFNLLLGTAGLVSFGHGAYFGIGAYAFGLAQLHFSSSLWVSIAVAALAGGIAGLFVGAFISHRRGIYYAFMTIAFAQIFWTIAIKWYRVTGGEDGLLNIPRAPADFGVTSFDLSDNRSLYYFVLAVFVIVMVGMWRLVNSPYGRVLAAIRQSETRAAHLGYPVWRYKLSAFALSALVSALAGSLFAMAQRSAFPDVMSVQQSGLIVMMVLVGGGLVSFWGPVIGVVVFILARDILGALTFAWMIYFGMLFMLIVLFRPEGLAGIARSLAARWR